MANLGTGDIIYSLRKRIQEIQAELDELGTPPESLPELISSANLLRSNEYLSKSNSIRSELIDAYSQYSSSIESLLATVFEIQNELKEILKEQSSLISNSTKKPKTKTPKTKTVKKSSKK